VGVGGSIREVRCIREGDLRTKVSTARAKPWGVGYRKNGNAMKRGYAGVQGYGTNIRGKIPHQNTGKSRTQKKELIGGGLWWVVKKVVNEKNHVFVLSRMWPKTRSTGNRVARTGGGQLSQTPKRGMVQAQAREANRLKHGVSHRYSRSQNQKKKGVGGPRKNGGWFT